MTSLYQNSDAILLLKNDVALDLLSKPGMGVSLRDINSCFSDAILGLYSPTSSLTPTDGGVSIGMEPWEMCRSLAPMPSLKLLKCRYLRKEFCRFLRNLLILKLTSLILRRRHVSETAQSHINPWDKLSRSLLGQVKQDLSNSACIASLVVCRGSDYLSIDWKRKLKVSCKLLHHYSKGSRVSLCYVCYVFLHVLHIKSLFGQG